MKKKLGRAAFIFYLRSFSFQTKIRFQFGTFAETTNKNFYTYRAIFDKYKVTKDFAKTNFRFLSKSLGNFANQEKNIRKFKPDELF